MSTPALPRVELARFRTLSGSPEVDFQVHFNPESLEYSVSNTLREEGEGGRKKQFIDRTSATLTMTLVFDTTDTGEDVRASTDLVAALLRPVGDSGKQVPPNVEFSWGLYSFVGMVEKHKETIDFFAASGVPLRATVELTLVSQDVQFESGRNPATRVDGGAGREAALLAAPGGASGLARSLGDPRAARAIADANGLGSLRFGGEAGMAVGGGPQLRAEAGFAVGGGAGGRGGMGVGGGAGGAFGELRAPRPSAGAAGISGPRPSTSLGGAPAGPGAGACIGPTGRVEAGGGGAMGSEVGLGIDVASRIRFG